MTDAAKNVFGKNKTKEINKRVAISGDALEMVAKKHSVVQN